jgi:hypothetical protein
MRHLIKSQAPLTSPREQGLNATPVGVVPIPGQPARHVTITIDANDALLPIVHCFPVVAAIETHSSELTALSSCSRRRRGRDWSSRTQGSLSPATLVNGTTVGSVLRHRPSVFHPHHPSPHRRSGLTQNLPLRLIKSQSSNASPAVQIRSWIHKIIAVHHETYPFTF